MEACDDDIKNARKHLRLAFASAEERVLGREVVGHLRQALRHVLKAGISKIDEVESERTGKPSSG
jgi:hypothetical protein